MNQLSRFVDRAQLKMLERSMTAHARDWDGYYRVIRRFKPFGMPHKIHLNQIWAEWEKLVQLLAQEATLKRVLEIGTGRAGSTYFWSKLTKLTDGKSLIVTVDENLAARNYISLFGNRDDQEIISIVGDSHDAKTIERVERTIGDELVDLLYIDGDHSYEGVKQDFESYRKFCKPDALICFHDINPDYGITRGIETDAKSGDVYKFWRELKESHDCREIIAAPEQNGFGIGIIKNTARDEANANFSRPPVL